MTLKLYMIFAHKHDLHVIGLMTIAATEAIKLRDRYVNTL
jgi:hypothetical protein